MSKSTQLLEAAVADVIVNRPAEGERPTARQRAAIDRAFAAVLKIVAPRIRHFIKQYGLVNHWEDAEQVCAIGVHRAIAAYDPEKAMFTTFVNWQLRGELQGLRFRLMDDQRPSARKVEATTVSLQMTERGPDGEDISLETLIEDEGAFARTEACASEHLAQCAGEALMDEYVRHLRSVGITQLKRKARSSRGVARKREAGSALPRYAHRRAPHIDPEELRKLEERIERDRDIVARHLFGHGEDRGEGEEEADADQGLTRERIRQITRRAARLMGELAMDNPRFTPGREGQEAPPAPTPAQKTGLLPRGNHVPAGTGGTITVTSPDMEPDEERNLAANENAVNGLTGSSLRH
tara:strand:- start:60751 stop:61806 length:1056 start_codon:yes stop_codon:yes gene_type:complete